MTGKSKKLLIAVGGPKGSGKTDIIKDAVKKLVNFKIISTGRLLQRLSILKYQKNFIDLPSEEKTVIRDYYTKEVLDNDSNLILDIHFGEFEDGGYPCVIPNKIVPTISHFVLITNSTETIQNRRFLDMKDRRLDFVSTHLNVIGEEMLFNQLVQNNQSESLRIVNTDIKRSTEQLVNFIQNSTRI